MVWTFEFYRTQDGSHPTVYSMAASEGQWATRLTGRGQAQHQIPLANSGMSYSDIRDLSTGNKYTIVQKWGSHVTYAGVIQRVWYVRSKQMLYITSQELRQAYMNDRMLYGVYNYEPGGTVLSVSNKSHSGATRAVLAKAMSWDWFWELPIDLPADGSGGFSASWQHSERLKLEDHLTQIEADGCEINFRPYISSGNLRYATEVASQVTVGSATSLNADGGPIIDITPTFDYAREMTGLLGFGKGGTGAYAYGYSPGDGSAAIGVRDSWLSFPDIDGARLEAAVEAMDYVGYPTEQWSVDLNIWPNGPAAYAPGSLLNISISGDPIIPDGTHNMRVIALHGDLGTTVTAEVQRAAA